MHLLAAGLQSQSLLLSEHVIVQVKVLDQARRRLRENGALGAALEDVCLDQEKDHGAESRYDSHH